MAFLDIMLVLVLVIEYMRLIHRGQEAH
jgi:hypothetical protein